MKFVYSLYQLSKRRPGSQQCRLTGVGVELMGVEPITGFSGSLTHYGRFLVRDESATLNPVNPVTRLIPTDDELATALEDQRRLGLPAATVGGVLYYDLPHTIHQLSVNNPIAPIPTPPQFTLALFEGNGPTGLWRLKIENHGPLDITDVLLYFPIYSLEPQTLQLEDKVRELIHSYEAELAGNDQLDRFSVFSLSQHFTNTFLALETGVATLHLRDENLPDGLTNLQFKQVILQAPDHEGRGLPNVSFEISQAASGFNQVRVTRADGFSEDLDVAPQVLPPDERFPIIGEWQIRLSDPSQYTQLGDVYLFFMYAYEEVVT